MQELINKERTNGDVRTISGSLSTDLINPSNTESPVVSWSLNLLVRITASSWSVGASLRIDISIVPNLTTLEACGASCSVLASRSCRGANWGSLARAWSLRFGLGVS
jgi:hypothetical protein